MDPWLLQMQNIDRDVDEIMVQIMELARMRRMNVNASKVSTTIRSKLQHLSVDITNLDEALLRAKASYSITEKEFTRRADLVYALKQKQATLQTQFRQAASAENQDERQALLSPSRPTSGRVWGMPQETEETRGMDDKTLIEKQRHVMQDQDQSLDALRDTVLRQKEVSVAIGSELDYQKGLLNEISDKVDKTDEKVRRETKRTIEITRKDAMGISICCIVLLIVAAILLFFLL